MRLSVGVIFGGVPNGKSVRTVARGLDVLVATPGRLLDLIDQRALSLRELEILVLDEADQMLDLGFIHALKRIVALVPPKRQTLFFSATMPRAIKELADKYLTNPAEVSVTPTATTVDRIEQSVTMVNQTEKAALLAMVLKGEGMERALVFSRTKHGADKIVRMLEAAGIAASAIHGNKSQVQRERAIAAFKSGAMPVLVATDIAARGIDIPGVSHVVNFERGNLRDIERTTRQKIPVTPLPADFMAAAEAFKRLKPAPKAQPERSHTKSDRRHDGQQRRNRNNGPQRHGQRAEGHAAHRSNTQDRSGQRRDSQRNDGARSSYRPEAHREASSEQRFPQRADGGQPTGGQPKRKFHRGPRRPGGPRRAQG
jgi:ATP-dependent RNA helicase RhlE